MVQKEVFPAEQVKKEAIKLGVYLGLLSFAISTISMYVLMNANDFKVFSMVTGTLTLVVMIVLAGYFASVLRKAAGGFWTFSEALKNIFIMLAINVIITTVGGAVFNLVNPEPQQVVFDKTINMTIETLESVGIEDDVIDKQVAELEKTRDDLRVFSPGQTLKGMGVNLIIYFVFALILAAIFKREKPAFLRVNDEGEITGVEENNNQI